MMNKRPTGVIVIAILGFILGVLSLLWSGLVLGVGGLSSVFGSLIGAENVAAFGSSSSWTGVLGLVTAGVQILVGFGLLALQRWAWYLAMFGIALTIFQGVVGLFTGGLLNFLCGGIGLIIPVIILIYLIRPGIRGVFGI